MKFTLSIVIFLSLNTCIAAGNALQLDAYEATTKFIPAENSQNLKGDSWVKSRVKHEADLGKVDLSVVLDQHQYPALKPIIEKFAKENNVSISLSDGTCGISAGLLSRKVVDIGGFCCSPGINDRLPGLQFHTLGISSIALFTNKQNPVDNISLVEAKAIYAGDLNKWTNFPAINKSAYYQNYSEIQPVARLHCKHRPGHWRSILNDEDQFSFSLLEVGSIPDMFVKVSEIPQAIGYETLWMHHLNTSDARILKVDGVSPDDRDALAQGDYLLYRVFNLTTWQGEAMNPLANKLVAYLITHIEDIPEKFGLVPVHRLKDQGWLFNVNELIGEPQQTSDMAPTPES